MEKSAIELEVENLKSQLADMKESNSTFRKEIYDRMRKVENENARIDERYKNILKELDALGKQNVSILDQIKELSEKPVKRWDTAVTSFISAIAGIIAGIVGQHIFGGK